MNATETRSDSFTPRTVCVGFNVVENTTKFCLVETNIGVAAHPSQLRTALNTYSPKRSCLFTLDYSSASMIWPSSPDRKGAPILPRIELSASDLANAGISSEGTVLSLTLFVRRRLRTKWFTRTSDILRYIDQLKGR